MSLWHVPITIIEHGRHAFVEAETKAEAMQKAKRAEWLDCGDTEYFTVKLGRGPVLKGELK